MDSLIQHLSRQTGFEFSFNSSKISPSQKITLPSKQPDLEQVLARLQQSFGIQHKLVGNHIILIDQPKRTATANISKTGNNRKKQTSKFPAKTISASVNKAKADTVVTEQAKIVDVAAPEKAAVAFTKNDTAVSRQIDSAVTSAPEKDIRATDTAKIVKIDTPLPASGNSTTSSATAEPHLPLLLDLGLQGVGLSIEPKLGKATTIVFGAGIGGGYFVTGKRFSYVFMPGSPEAYFTVNPRLYFRKKTGNTEKNEGGYIGFKLKYTTEHLFSDKGFDDTVRNWVSFKGARLHTLLFNFHWGYQKSFGKRWLFNGHVGPGYSFR
ncbi:MAG: hypothetical protein WCF67_18540, partial [Chitinophagaceae bacterium]